MSKLTMIGLGAMGSAVAKTLIDRGHELTVWNRSPQKIRELAEQGATPAESITEAIAASPVILICIHGYQATRKLLDDAEVASLLEGRTIVQMSTGTPAEAREAQSWIDKKGGRYLDCAIMAYPPDIGTREAQLLIAGEPEAYQEIAAITGSLGGDIRYLGPSIGAAAALDLAVVTRLATITVATVYGIHLCESEGVPLRQFTDLYPEGDRSHHLADNIAAGQFDRNIAVTVATSIEVISTIRDLASGLGICAELPDFLLGLYHRAADAGLLEQDNAALIEVFRAHRD